MGRSQRVSGMREGAGLRPGVDMVRPHLHLWTLTGEGRHAPRRGHGERPGVFPGVGAGGPVSETN